jgi:pyruvate,water dikinase
MISASAAPGETGVESVGGKAASLFRLVELNCQTPPFFVLTADAYRADGGTSLSSATRELVLAAWADLGGPEHAYAVRSSGVAEDSVGNSFAGVFDTVLDVRGADALIAAIEQCWASHRSGQAAAYREGRGGVADPAMAVVVQRMVDADWAGVSFTADPLSQALSVTVVNAVEGGADKLVSGLVNPEEIKLRSATGEIIERRAPAGARPLPDWILREVASESQRVAAAYGFPQDLEWASEGEELFLLQSRPITTVVGVFNNRALEPWAPGGDPDAPDRIWSRAFADEIWTPPVSPLFYDAQNLTAFNVHYLKQNGDNGATPPDVFKYYRASAYIDVDVLGRLHAILPPIMRRPGLLALSPRDAAARVKRKPWNWLGTLRRLWIVEVANGPRWGLRQNHRFLARSWAAFEARAHELIDHDLRPLTDAELDAHIADVWALAVSVGPECQVAVLFHAYELKLLLSGLLDRWCGSGDDLYGAVSAALPDSQTVRETDAIWEIAEALRAAGPAAVNAAAASTWAEFEQIGPGLGAQPALDLAASFLANERHRGANYKDLIWPRWGDDRELLWSVIQSFLPEAGARPAEINADGGGRRMQAQRDVMVSLAGAPIKRWILEKLFKYNEIYASLRDNHRFYYDQVWWLVRLAYLEIGRRLHAAGKLASPEDVFFLCRPELERLKYGELAVSLAAERIAIRRAEWLETQRRLPPKFLRGYAPYSDRPVGEMSAGLTGIGASPGHAEGAARVIYELSELASVERGEILVTRQTDPGWTPAFARLGGLVLETGGVLAHGASLCREFGLPCVTAVEDATSLIRDGDRIIVNGSAGVVEIVAAARETAPV